MTSNTAMRTIGQIPEGTRFWVPKYQRGYRWSGEQIQALLDDFLDAQRRKVDTYFLQPLTLRPTPDGAYEVIDGQQRLTTLFLVKHYLARRFQDLAKALAAMSMDNGMPPVHEMPYTLDYQTRPDSGVFLHELPDVAAQTVDEDFMRRAYNHVATWFNGGKRLPLTSTVDTPSLTDWDRFLTEKVRLIWYEVDPSVDARRLFLNLNRGRISLSNSELIKALLLANVDEGLRGDDSEKEAREVEITTQWDEMEQALHEPEFWGFLGGDASPGQATKPRMEYFFQLLHPASDGEDDRNRFRTYVRYDRRIQEARSDQGDEDLGTFVRRKIWREEIRATFLRLREWFLDNELYHKIGFLIAIQKGGAESLVRELLSRAHTVSKADFIRDVDLRIALSVGLAHEADGQLEFRDDLLDEIRYGRDTDRLHDLLLLHNCLYCWKPPGLDGSWTEGSERYSFQRGGGSLKWSLEHVNPQAGHAAFRTKNQQFNDDAARTWLQTHRPYLALLSDQPLEQKVSDLLDQPILREDAFQATRDSILRAFGREYYGEDPEEPLDRIGNLTLLGLRENIQLGNGVFAQKRQAILRMVAEGRFVPPCTRRLFLKAFVPTEDADLLNQAQAFWTKADADVYKAEIEAYLELLRKGLTGWHRDPNDGGEE